VHELLQVDTKRIPVGAHNHVGTHAALARQAPTRIGELNKRRE
jgi:hypothetical protein